MYRELSRSKPTGAPWSQRIREPEISLSRPYDSSHMNYRCQAITVSVHSVDLWLKLRLAQRSEIISQAHTNTMRRIFNFFRINGTFIWRAGGEFWILGGN